MPPLSETEGSVSYHRVFNYEGDLAWENVAELHAAQVTCTNAIETIMATSGKTKAITQHTALAISWLGFACCAKITPHLNRLNPLNITCRSNKAQLQHIVAAPERS